MPEVVNTTPLWDTSNTEISEKMAPAMIEVNHVSMVFNMANQRLNNLKEYAIALARRELVFKEFHALNDITIKINKGDVFGILGTNGSGKSTLLKIIAGVLEPTEGSVRIDGNIAPLIELGAGFDHELTARENIYLNGALLGYSKSFIEEHFDEIVEFAEIRPFLDVPLKNYSSGMVARIAFAIATIIVPDILIVDEVLSVGDFMFQQKCENRIQSLINEHNTTVLIVSHSNDQIERLCNKAIWIEKGHTRMLGTAKEVCRTYRALGGHTGSPEAEKLLFDLLNSPELPAHGIVETIAGESRYGTNAALNTRHTDDASGGFAVITLSDDYQTRLIAAGLAGGLGGVNLITKPGELPDVTAVALSQLNPSAVLILERGHSIASSVDDAIRKVIPPDATIDRICNSELNLLSKETLAYGSKMGATWGSTAFVASYDSIYSSSVIASALGLIPSVVLFVANDELITADQLETFEKMGINELALLDYPPAVTSKQLNQIRNMGFAVTELLGSVADEASAAATDWIVNASKKLGVEASSIVIGPQDNLSYAISALPLVRDEKAIPLTINHNDLDSMARAIGFIKDHAPDTNRIFVIGGGECFSHVDKEFFAKAKSLS